MPPIPLTEAHLKPYYIFGTKRGMLGWKSRAISAGLVLGASGFGEVWFGVDIYLICFHEF